jgi:hypothetical protein
MLTVPEARRSQRPRFGAARRHLRNALLWAIGVIVVGLVINGLTVKFGPIPYVQRVVSCGDVVGYLLAQVVVPALGYRVIAQILRRAGAVRNAKLAETLMVVHPLICVLGPMGVMAVLLLLPVPLAVVGMVAAGAVAALLLVPLTLFARTVNHLKVIEAQQVEQQRDSVEVAVQ